MTYDLTTARGVLLALADGVELRTNDAVIWVAEDSVMYEAGLHEQEIPLLPPNGMKPWSVVDRPKPIEMMDVPELARELYGDGARETAFADSTPCIVAGSRDAVKVSAPTREDMLRHLRVLVRAKRAGEL